MKKGFTLIELLIATSIYAILSIAIYATFSSGMGVWRRAGEINIAQRRNTLRIEKLSRELRQTFSFKDIGFYGSKDKIYFPAIQDLEITRITYFFDAGKKIVFRSSERLSDILSQEKEEQKLQPKTFTYLADIDKLTISYFYFDLQKNAYLWKDDWIQENPPLAVKFDIISGETSYATTIFIPTAS